MKLPFQNLSTKPLTIFIEPLCFQYEVPVGGAALVTLEDGAPHVFDVHDENWISIWDEGLKAPAKVEVFPKLP